MNVSLQGKTIVVTGGVKRLGKAIALECAAAGANVVVTYRSGHTVQETLADLRALAPESKFAAFPLEISDSEQVNGFTAEVFETFPNVCGLVNNAAIFKRTPFETLEESDFDEHIAVNLKGPFLLSRSFGREFMEREGGSIVNMADIYGIRPLGNYVPYSISKAGVIMLTQSLAKALAPKVRVNCICPGTILPPSEIQGEADEEAELVKRVPFGRLGTPEEIAQTAVFL
ncbi:SDR family oxidoreductase, partial [bacterium]